MGNLAYSVYISYVNMKDLEAFHFVYSLKNDSTSEYIFPEHHPPPQQKKKNKKKKKIK